MRSRRGVALAVALSIATSLSVVGAQAEPAPCAVTIYEDGWALVSLNWSSAGFVSVIPLLPGAESLLVSDDSGTPLDYNVSEGVLLVWEASDSINVTYETQAITAKEGDVWTVNLSVDLGTCEIRLPRGSLLVGMSELPSAVTSVDNRTIVYMETPCWVSYVLLARSHGPQVGREMRYLWVGVAAAGVVVAAIVALLLRRRGRPAGERPPLSYDDIALLRKLEQMGGSAYLSELRAALEMPKTTIWRRARRLSEGGFIEMEKTPRGSILRITEDGRRVIS
ncbi:MAG: hypothetical protein DRO01_05890 [Thermoproteota archaeon]|nr:MAG: hypothetical protein DRO01_05890 [Candidatus Korarchaeota archaeon]